MSVFSFGEPALAVLVEGCCIDASDGPFEKFRSSWHRYLEAAFALVGADWMAAEAVYKEIYDEYRSVFRRGHNPRIDYECYLLAIAYSFLVQKTGERPTQLLVANLLAAGVPETISKHEMYILLFCSILRMPDHCVAPLLRSCFRAQRLSAIVPFLRYRAILPMAPAQCITSLQRLLNSALC